MLYYLIICKYLDYKSYFKFRSISKYILNYSNNLDQNIRNNINLYYPQDVIKKTNLIKFISPINEFNFCKLINPMCIYIKNVNVDLNNNILNTNNINTIKFFLMLKNKRVIKSHNKNLCSKSTNDKYINYSLHKKNKMYIKFNTLNIDRNNFESLYFNKNVVIKLIGFKIENYNYYTAIFNLIKIL